MRLDYFLLGTKHTARIIEQFAQDE
jgi:hypothetical protein